MENALQKIKCPVCHKHDAQSIGVKNGHVLYKSALCGLVFVWPVPGNSQSIYGEDYFRGARSGFGYVDYEHDKEPQLSAMREYISAANRFKPGNGRLLDVGAASGLFVSLAQKNGWNAEGVEVSDFAADLGRKKGLKIKTGTVYSEDFKPDSYEVISLLDVFEHVPDPEADLRRIRELLKPNGIIIINMPDGGSLWARLWGIRWHLIIPPEHLFIFNKFSIAELLNRNNFATLAHRKIGKSFSLPYILHMLYAWTSWGPFARLAGFSERSFLRHLSFPINLRDNMFVVAQKT